MKTSIRCLNWVFLAAAVVVFCAPASSQAGMVLRLTSGASVVTIQDGGVGDLNPTAGVITYTGAVGSFTLNVSTALSKPTLAASSSIAQMDLNSVDMTMSGSGDLKIELTDTDFPATPAGYLMGSVGGTVGGGTGSTAEFFAYKDPSNTEFGTGDLSVHLGAYSQTGAFPTGFGGNDQTGHDALSDPYSMTIVAKIHHTGNGTTSFDFALTNVVPEPATALLALLGGGSLALGMLKRRRQGKVNA